MEGSGKQTTNGWPEHKLLVLKSLTSLEEGLEDLKDEFNSVKTEVRVMKGQAILIATIIGIVAPIVISVLMELLHRK